jgi:hypothetical protein
MVEDATMPDGLTVRTTPATGVVARLLRRILEWLNARERVVTTALPTKAEAILPEREPEEDALTPERIARRTAALLWAHRGAIEVGLDYDEDTPGRERHSEYAPTASVRLPGGILLTIPSVSGPSTVTTPDGEAQHLSDAQNEPLRTAWNAIVAEGLVEILGLDDGPVPEIDDAGPSETALTRLADAIGGRVEHHPPVRCAEKRRTWRSSSFTQFERIEADSCWSSLGDDVLMRTVWRKAEHGRSEGVPIAVLSHPLLGNVAIPGEPVQQGLERRRTASFARALGIALELPAHLPMPRGNAQAARVLRLCREAVAAEPDLADAAGTPIRPLVDQHLPELMRRHAAAAAIAPAHELAAIDADLAEGIERVRRAVEEALSCSAVARRMALQAQLGFLALRHPDPTAGLQCLPDGSAA